MNRTFGPRPIVFGGPLSPGVRAILFATVGVFLFQLLAGVLAQTHLERLFGLVPYDVTHHLFLWQGVTYLFLHGGFFHILFNMLALWMFGTELEWLWGTPRFVRFYFATGIGAALCSTIVSPNSTIPIIGASGAIYGLLAAYGLLFPDRILLLYLVIPIKAKYFVLILGVIAFWFSLTVGRGRRRGARGAPRGDALRVALPAGDFPRGTASAASICRFASGASDGGGTGSARSSRCTTRRLGATDEGPEDVALGPPVMRLAITSSSAALRRADPLERKRRERRVDQVQLAVEGPLGRVRRRGARSRTASARGPRG